MFGRRVVVAVTTLGVLAVAGCTGATPTRTRTTATAATTATSVTSPSPAPPATTVPSAAAPGPTCPTPAAATSPPTDFPHPTLTRYPATPAGAADDGLARQGLAALATFGGPVATSAFQHYLDATGSYLALPVDGLLATNPALVTELNRALVGAAAGAVQRAVATTTPPCTTVAFTSGWLPHDDVADPDWHYALGRFSVQVLGTATRDPSTPGARVSFRVAVGDTYDFDPGSTFARFGQLALDGHAADYLVGGLTTPRTAVVTSAAALASPGLG